MGLEMLVVILLEFLNSRMLESRIKESQQNLRILHGEMFLTMKLCQKELLILSPIGHSRWV